MIKVKKKHTLALSVIIAIVGLSSASFLVNPEAASSATQYTSVTKYTLPDLFGDTYLPPMAFPMSDGTTWYTAMGKVRHYDPTTNTTSAEYSFPNISPTRYSYAVGPDDNIYQMGSTGEIKIFDTDARQTRDLSIDVNGFESCESSYGNFAFNGNNLVAPVSCYRDDGGGGGYIEEAGLALYDIYAHKWSFVAAGGVEYFSMPSIVSDGAGRLAVVDEDKIFVFETDCTNKELALARTLQPNFLTDGIWYIDMVGMVPIALDQKGNLYNPVSYYYDEILDEDIGGGIIKTNVITGENTFILDPTFAVDPDGIEWRELPEKTVLVRGTDDNIYYTTEYGIHRLDTTTGTISIFDSSVPGVTSGYNKGTVTMTNNGHIWTTWEDSNDYSVRGLAAFSIIGGNHPSSDPYVCSSDGSGPETPSVPGKPVVPGVPNTGWHNL
jgi:hypothetical protein